LEKKSYVTENLGELCISEIPKLDWNIVDSFMDTVPPVELKEEHVDENVVAEQNMSDIKHPPEKLVLVVGATHSTEGNVNENSRFGAAVSDDEIKVLIDSNENANTRKNTQLNVAAGAQQDRPIDSGVKEYPNRQVW
jgi:hypothetical protein